MQTLPMPWGRLAYTDAGGQGSAVIFLHGSGCDSADWDGVIDAMGGAVRAIRMDFRGHGASDTPSSPFTLDDLAGDVLTLAEHLQLKRVLLVGHSLGGMAAMSAAAKSAAVAGLVLVEGWTSLTAAKTFAPGRFYGRLDEQTVRQIQEKSQRTKDRFAPGQWEAFWRTVVDFNAEPFLQAATIPIFEVYGEAGRTDDTEANLLVPKKANISLRWIAQAGHYLPTETPQQVADICARAAAKIRED